MKKSLLIIFSIVLFIAVTAILKEPQQEKSEPLKVKIGLYKGAASSLMIYANKLGYLKDENLEVELKFYATGRDAMKGMLKGEVDYANCTDFVATKNSFKKQNFKILSSMAEASINGMLAKKSTGILNAQDIKNKKVGTTIGTATEYYTGVFLEQYNLKLSDVDLINVPRKKRLEVMQKNSVDALFAWEPFIYKLKQEYKNDMNYYPMPVGFEFYFIFVVNENFHIQNPVISSKILRALYKAEKYKDANYKNFEIAIKNYFNFEEEYSKYILKKHDFRLTFPYSLSTVMSNQASWLKQNNLVKEEGIKSFNKLFDARVLKEISPSAVTVME